MSIILAIDIGTSSAKALAVDHRGNEIFAASESYPTHHPKHDLAEQDPEEIFLAVKKIIQACPPETKERLSAISFSSAMHSLIGVSEQNTPLTPLIIWSDLRSREEARQLRDSNHGKEIEDKTGTPVHPMSPLCKLIWFKKNQPDVFKAAFKFIGIKEYIWFKFFGCFEVDHGIASATGLFETGALKWYEPALAVAGIQKERLSTSVSVYHQQVLINSQLLDELGFSKSIPFVIGSSDGCLANLGSFAIDAETLSLTIGTSGAVRRRVNTRSKKSETRVFRYHLDEETLIEGGASNNGAVLLEWFSKNFLKEEVNISSFIVRACKISAGAEGLIFLPYVFGERAPLYDPDASGIFFGVKQHHTVEHFMRAVLEGIGFALYAIGESIEASSGGWSTIVASGGFTKSEEWVQIIANIFGKPVRINTHENASALGAAMLGFSSIDLQHDFPRKPSKVCEPQMSDYRAYQIAFNTYKKINALHQGLSLHTK